MVWVAEVVESLGSFLALYLEAAEAAVLAVSAEVMVMD